MHSPPNHIMNFEYCMHNLLCLLKISSIRIDCLTFTLNFCSRSNVSALPPPQMALRNGQLELAFDHFFDIVLRLDRTLRDAIEEMLAQKHMNINRFTLSSGVVRRHPGPATVINQGSCFPLDTTEEINCWCMPPRLSAFGTCGIRWARAPWRRCIRAYTGSRTVFQKR